ncbi:hypothetical protein DDR33_03015 [Pararcticibacter amylolyticus]|uniref:OmpA-like domain-containing protein n=1 Tax=Pararcticibacter amylolyticus TaxID=2173175 RepID=A0A2U2PLG0_9SPHI|nr:hypothetical protein DDR33_03015 [Pararcticibacter amylolyticus]
MTNELLESGINNKELSEKRANVVMNALTANGISKLGLKVLMQNAHW